MSSYQQRYLTGHLYKESPPDYLTCGHCAKEFVLDNITLFIAHKAGGCDDWAQSKGSPSGFSGYDTSSPLTCSSCSRVFMTARGLLQHVQQDHQMSICLQKGPLFIDGDSAPAEGDTGSARPPPAHASINSRDYMTTDKQKSPCPTASSAATACCDHSDQSDQPTDLSMTCSNGLGKAVVKCNDHGCKITLEPKKNVRDAPAPSEVTDANKAATLPKKRRFLTATDNEFTSNSGNPSNPNNANDVMQAIPSNASDVTKNVNIIESGEMTNALEDIAEGDDDSVFYQRTTNVEESKEAESASNVSVYVTAQYAKDELCCVSLSTQKEKNAKLKKLLETEPPADSKALESVMADADSQCADKSTTKLVYKFPFLVPKSPDSVKPLLAVTEGSADGGGSRSVARGSDSSPHLPPAGDSYGQASRGPGLGFVPGSTLEQNIDRIIRASISSDAYPEEFDILRMETDTPGSLKSGSESSRSPPTGHPSMARSPRLVTPTQQYRRMSQSSVDYDMPMLINAVKSSDIYDSPIYKLKHPPPVTPGDLSNKMSPVPVATFLPPGLSPHPSMDDQVGLHRQKDVPHLDSASPPGGLRRYNNSLARPEPPTFMPVDGANPGHSDRHFLQGHYATGTQGSVERAVGLDKAFRKGFGHPRVGVLDPGLPSLTSVQQQHQALYRDVADSQWLGLQEDNSSNGEFHGAVGRSGMDPLDMMAGSDLSALDLEDKGYEGKAMKKRRYPTSRPFKCDHCDQAFNQRIHLKKHMSKHTGVKPFKCQQCDYSTVERSHLKVHYRIHTGEKPYRCMFCDYATAQNSTLKIHLKRHHEGQLTSEGGGRRPRDASHLAGLREPDPSILNGRDSGRDSSPLSLGSRPYPKAASSSPLAEAGAGLCGDRQEQITNHRAAEYREANSNSLDNCTATDLQTYSRFGGESEAAVGPGESYSSAQTGSGGGHSNNMKSVIKNSSSAERADRHGASAVPGSGVKDANMAVRKLSLEPGSGELHRRFGHDDNSVPGGENGAKSRDDNRVESSRESDLGKSSHHGAGGQPNTRDLDISKSHASSSPPMDTSTGGGGKSDDRRTSLDLGRSPQVFSSLPKGWSVSTIDAAPTTTNSTSNAAAETVTLTTKSDSLMSLDQVDDEDVDDLDYSPALPSVVIPEKAFVRG